MLYRSLIPTQWDVDRVLNRFVRDPAGLRSQMGRCDALISGSAALQFFERVTWKESDLDIFVEAGAGAERLSDHLCQTEGYRATSKKIVTEEDIYAMQDLVEVTSAFLFIAKSHVVDTGSCSDSNT